MNANKNQDAEQFSDKSIDSRYVQEIVISLMAIKLDVPSTVSELHKRIIAEIDDLSHLSENELDYTFALLEREGLIGGSKEEDNSIVFRITRDGLKTSRQLHQNRANRSMQNRIIESINNLANRLGETRQ